MLDSNRKENAIDAAENKLWAYHPILSNIRLEITKTDQNKISNNLYLTNREQECLYLFVKGYTMKMIARTLSISPRTVEQHLRNIRIRYKITSKNQLIKIWYEFLTNLSD